MPSRETRPSGSHVPDIAPRARATQLSDAAVPTSVVRNADLGLRHVGAAPAIVEPRQRSEFLCRCLNVAVAGTALVALSPVMLLTAIAVRVTSPGPIMYTQTRVGINRRRPRVPQSVLDRRGYDLGGQVFRIYKFRTMRVDAEKAGVQWAAKNDPRVTSIGRFLRLSRLDELPQLVNVLKGDMNIVGPRPERPSLVRTLARSIDEYPLRHLAKPGITGWAQINLAYDSCLDDVRQKVRYDLEYLSRHGIAEDLKIMLRTVPTMVFRRGSR